MIRSVEYGPQLPWSPLHSSLSELLLLQNHLQFGRYVNTAFSIRFFLSLLRGYLCQLYVIHHFETVLSTYFMKGACFL